MAYALKIFAGNANPTLSNEIAKFAGVRLSPINLTNFSDGETFIQIEDNVRGADVFIIQPTCTPVNENLMELLIILDAIKRSSARRVTAVLPYYGYARQDRKNKPRVPISSKLVADLLETAGAQRVVTLDLHAGQIQGYFDIPCDHLLGAPVLIEYMLTLGLQNTCIVSPDAGGVERARFTAQKLGGANLAIIDKRRTAPNVAHAFNVIGDVSGADCVIVDDMVDTAGTLTQAAMALKNEGASRVFACCVHGVLSGPALERINDSCLEQLIVTNSVNITEEKMKQCPKLTVLSVGKLLGEAIRRIHNEESVSSLFI
eukprot:TRINITY_DN2703_c0_g2_i2.p1 TRINITY_DN2703_c0_g2~~TRINITY_DN2703_c0_g2_i2.p1  ORF type:complete len:316 (-),score=101.25 TRINITY_DN2703_c0_g2_i2:557-1504(-)